MGAERTQMHREGASPHRIGATERHLKPVTETPYKCIRKFAEKTRS